VCVLAVCAGVYLAWSLGVYDALRLENLARLQRWVDTLGPWAPILYTAAYVILELIFVPALPLTVLAGIAFGPLWGTAYAWLGATVSAVLAFLIARHGGREMVERWIVRHPRLARLDAAVARHGWRILAFTRLVPVFPFNMQNYVYGLTGIRLSTYLVVTGIFMIPGTAALAIAGDALVEGGTSYTWLLIYLGVAAVLLVPLWFVPKRLGHRSGILGDLTDRR
jgi:uncharacterized membrane protein YdjX (TVP38/TMEM64 family)